MEVGPSAASVSALEDASPRQDAGQETGAGEDGGRCPRIDGHFRHVEAGQRIVTPRVSAVAAPEDAAAENPADAELSRARNEDASVAGSRPQGKQTGTGCRGAGDRHPGGPVGRAAEDRRRRECEYPPRRARGQSHRLEKWRGQLRPRRPAILAPECLQTARRQHDIRRRTGGKRRGAGRGDRLPQRPGRPVVGRAIDAGGPRGPMRAGIDSLRLTRIDNNLRVELSGRSFDQGIPRPAAVCAAKERALRCLVDGGGRVDRGIVRRCGGDRVDLIERGARGPPAAGRLGRRKGRLREEEQTGDPSQMNEGSHPSPIVRNPGSVRMETMSASLGVRLRRYWIAGLLVLAPTALTLWVVWKLFTFFDDILGWQLRARGVSVVGLGFVLLNVLLLLLGFIATN